jgi:predicted MFS family arabinose efflux permease
VRVVANRLVLTGLAITLLALTGFVAVFTYVAPMLTTLSGFSPDFRRSQAHEGLIVGV